MRWENILKSVLIVVIVDIFANYYYVFFFVFRFPFYRIQIEYCQAAGAKRFPTQKDKAMQERKFSNFKIDLKNEMIKKTEFGSNFILLIFLDRREKPKDACLHTHSYTYMKTYDWHFVIHECIYQSLRTDSREESDNTY